MEPVNPCVQRNLYLYILFVKTMSVYHQLLQDILILKHILFFWVSPYYIYNEIMLQHLGLYMIHPLILCIIRKFLEHFF